MGPSGSGKSTLLHLLGGLERPTSGEIWLDGQRVDGLSQARWAVLRRRHIGFMFQFFNLVSNMTVADNVELAALMGGATRRQARERRDRAAGRAGPERQGRRGARPGCPAASSSGWPWPGPWPTGRACCWPTSRPATWTARAAEAVLRLLTRAHAAGQAILLVTHDARVASAAERVISLFDGMVVDDAALLPAAAAVRDRPARPASPCRPCSGCAAEAVRGCRKG